MSNDAVGLDLMTRFKIVAAMALLGFGSAALADKPKQNTPPPAVFSAILDCRSIADNQARLACYDEKAAALADASSKRAIVVTDREQLRKERRNLFGFTLPTNSLLGDDQGDEAKKFETTVVSGRRGPYGAWIVVLAVGGTWEQTDSRELALAPKANQKVVITRGALGSFFVSIDGQQPVRMRRIQ